MAQVIRLNAARWADLRQQAEAEVESSDPVVTAVAAQLEAPVRGTLLATAGGAGAVTWLLTNGAQALLVTEPIARRDGGMVASGEIQLTIVEPGELWTAVAAVLPPLEALRAPAVAGSRGTEVPGTPEQLAALLEREEATLQVSIEAWRQAESPSRVWARLWSVVEGRLLDVRTRDGEAHLRERPPGAVAAELEWALAGAFAETRGSLASP
jgi:hypothetical protein